MRKIFKQRLKDCIDKDTVLDRDNTKIKICYILSKDIYTLKDLQAEDKKARIDNRNNAERKKESYSFIDSNEIPNEYWKVWPYNEKYLVSNLGRIKFKLKEDFLLVKQVDRNNDGYLTLNKELFQEDYGITGTSDLLKNPFVYRFVADTWLDEEVAKCSEDPNCPLIVHHIDNNGYNNNVENLMWVTSCEHRQIHKSQKCKN